MKIIGSCNNKTRPLALGENFLFLDFPFALITIYVKCVFICVNQF